jgi:lipopolysaccharide export system protein LptA
MRSFTDMDKNISTLNGNVRIFDDLSMLTCDTVNLYSAARPAQKPVKEQASDPDADPFALRRTENYAPSQILLTNDIELKKVECIGNVRLSRLVNKQKMQAGGERADYNVQDRQIVISGKTPNRAWISSDGRKQLSDKLIYHLSEERFESSGDTETILKK